MKMQQAGWDITILWVLLYHGNFHDLTGPLPNLHSHVKCGPLHHVGVKSSHVTAIT